METTGIPPVPRAGAVFEAEKTLARSNLQGSLRELLKDRIAGKVIERGDQDYEAARRVYNAAIDTKYPRVIIKVKNRKVRTLYL
jgi:hypothetical protein